MTIKAYLNSLPSKKSMIRNAINIKQFFLHIPIKAKCVNNVKSMETFSCKIVARATKKPRKQAAHEIYIFNQPGLQIFRFLSFLPSLVI